ncbi:MAG: spoVD 2 [Lacunisphaera sp.]|nr:spoVD 2 [Lacunisphaera sp.]MDB6166177.1 spoVD 2 [Lacunisphaera sp.]
MSRLIETHSARNPRLLFFHGLVAALLAVLVGGLAYRQLFKTALYSERARVQNQRRVITPGPRGNILDRERRVLVGNRLRLSVTLDLAELRPEFKQQYAAVKANYAKLEKSERPNADQLQRIARTAVAQRYLDQINFILGRNEQVRTDELNRHMNQSLLLPFLLLDDLAPEEYARLIERLPVNSSLQVYASSTRYYPFDSAAAHTLGYTGVNSNPDIENFEGEDLLTFKSQGSYGRDGLEKKFDAQLQGETGAAIYLVDPKGYKVKAPDLPQRKPVQGHDLVTSLDIDLQQAAEEAIGDKTGAAVAIDVKTGEVLVLASKPDYDLNAFVPHLTLDEKKEIDENNAWFNQALSGAYPPGSTFKLITAIAGLRSGRLQPNQTMPIPCEGRLTVGNRVFTCDNGDGRHGDLKLAEAIGHSCDVYFYQAGLAITPEVVAAEARRFHLDQPTGIELPGETSRMVIPDPAWKQRTQKEKWFPGDTANMSIGQGYVLVTPLEMACFAASLARDEVYTKPTLLHDPQRPAQHSERTGLTPPQRAALLEGMEGSTIYGTASTLSLAAFKIPGVRIAGKTGTAQKRVVIDGKLGTINCAWFICFAPLDNPEIAVAVMIEGDKVGETTAGGLYSAPAADRILKAYFEKKNRPKDAAPTFNVK